MSEPANIKVWDLLVRICHWSLVAGVGLAFLTAEDLPETHEAIGYVIGALVAVRILWGLLGPQYARFSDFVYGPAKVYAYLRDLVNLKGQRYLGHSPAGGAMVVVLLAVLVVTVSTGIITESQRENAAVASTAAIAMPSPGDNGGRDKGQETFVREVHELSANLLAVLVAFHLGGVLLASIAHKENLVWSMVTGRKPVQKASGK